MSREFLRFNIILQSTRGRFTRESEYSSKHNFFRQFVLHVVERKRELETARTRINSVAAWSLQDNFVHSCVVGVPRSGVRNFAGIAVNATNTPNHYYHHAAVTGGSSNSIATASAAGTSLLSPSARSNRGESRERFAYSLNTRGAYI